MSSTLPGLLGQIADVVGETKALAIARALGGRYTSIAQNPGPDSPLARIVGVEDARRIAVEVGHGRVVIPMGPATRSAQVRAMLANGVSHSDISRALGVHQRTVEYHAKAVRDDRQMVLPLAQLTGIPRRR